jgi:hypothetical protein
MVTAHVVDDADDVDVEEVEGAGAWAVGRHPARNKMSSIAAAAQLTFLAHTRDSNMPGSRIRGFRSMPPV